MKVPKVLGKEQVYDPDDGMIHPADGGVGGCLLILFLVVVIILTLVLSASL